MRFFYRVTLQVGTGTPRSTEVEGLCVFDKRCILFGSEGSAKTFSSDTALENIAPQRSLPAAVVEAVDPIVLDTRITEDGSSSGTGEGKRFGNPGRYCRSIRQSAGFRPNRESALLCDPGPILSGAAGRDTQLLIPAYDYCIPQSECSGGDPEDPCGLFKNVCFPMSEFFPPNTVEMPKDYNGTLKLLRLPLIKKTDGTPSVFFDVFTICNLLKWLLLFYA